MRHPQRLVCVTTSGALGGAETSLLTLLGALRAIEPAWQMTVVAPAEGPLLERCRAAGIGAVDASVSGSDGGDRRAGERGALRPARLRAAFQLISTAAVLWPYLRRLRGELRRLKATIVHTNGIKAHVAASLTVPRGAAGVAPPRIPALPAGDGEIASPSGVAPFGDRREFRCGADDVRSVVGEARRCAACTTRWTHRCSGRKDRRSIWRPRADWHPITAWCGSAWSPRSPDGRGTKSFSKRWRVFARQHPVRAYVIGGAVYATAGSQWSPAELQSAGGGARAGGHGRFHRSCRPMCRPRCARCDIVVHASTEPEPFGMVIAEGDGGAAGGRCRCAAAARPSCSRIG